jgi:hypothetical protein
MKIFLADGRLGNQIFQYMFLKTIQKNSEKIIVIGFDDLFNIFNINDSSFVNIKKNNKWIRKFSDKILKPFFYKLSKLKVINSIEIEYEKILINYKRETTRYSKKNGLFTNITFIKLAYFQSENIFNKKYVKKLKIKNQFLKKAISVLKPFQNNYKIFIHIRRGDYKEFKVYGKNTLLSMNYFHNQIKWFLENKENCYFIFLSDEPEFIGNEFSYLENKVISKNSYEVDFAIMTLCNGAILSPSSFGWWGSYLMKSQDVVFAPKYWLGFESQENYHKDPLFSFIQEIEI